MARLTTLRDIVLDALRQQRSEVLARIERLTIEAEAGTGATDAQGIELVQLFRRLGELGAAVHDVAVCSDSDEDPRLEASLRWLGAFDGAQPDQVAGKKRKTMLRAAA